MSVELKPFIDESKFNKLLKNFFKEGWTKKGQILHKRLIGYLESIEGVSYEISYTNMENLGVQRYVWSQTKYNVPMSKRGHLKKYRGYKVLILVLNQPNGYKRTIGCYPLKRKNDKSTN